MGTTTPPGLPKMQVVHILFAEYEYGEDKFSVGNQDANHVVLGVWEDDKDAESFRQGLLDSPPESPGRDSSMDYLGDWDHEPGWSDAGWWLNLEAHPVIPSSRGGAQFVPPSVSAKDINTINRQRRQIGMSPIDMSAGWTAKELRDMVKSIEKHGRLPNPAYGRGDAALGGFLGSLAGRLVGAVVSPAGSLAYFGGIAGAMVAGHYWSPAQSQSRTRVGAGIGSAVFGSLGAALGAYIGSGRPDTKKNPYAYEEYRHLTDKEREFLLDLLLEGQAAKVQSALARSRGDAAGERRYEAKYDKAFEKLVQLEERLKLGAGGRSL